MTEVFVADTEILNDDKNFENALKLLPDWRREAVLRIKKHEQQKLSVLAYLLARRVLKERGINAEIRKDENGRPFIEGNPIQISISHSGTLAAAVFSDSPIGLDIEKNRPVIPGAVKIFSDEIRSRIKTPADFFEQWTRYEAHIKCQKPDVCFYNTTAYSDYTISVCSEREISHIDVRPLSFVPSDFS